MPVWGCFDCNGLFLKKGKHSFCDSMDGPGDYHAEWNKPVRERQTSYDLTYLGDLSGKSPAFVNIMRLVCTTIYII